MYKNIGEKIKTVAVIVMVLTILSAAANMLMTFDSGSDEEEIISIVVFVLSPLLGWLASVTLYGFGELICKATAIERNTRGEITVSETQNKLQQERQETLENLRAQGLISEEEYLQVLNK